MVADALTLALARAEATARPLGECAPHEPPHPAIASARSAHARIVALGKIIDGTHRGFEIVAGAITELELSAAIIDHTHVFDEIELRSRK